MTDHDEAVQIAISVPVYPQTTDEDHARAVVDALRARWEFVEPGKLAALRAQVEELKARPAWIEAPDDGDRLEWPGPALDAAHGQNTDGGEACTTCHYPGGEPEPVRCPDCGH